MKLTKTYLETHSPLAIAESLTEYWSPKIIDEVNDSYIKVAKLKGQLVWHSHEFEDEMFMVLKGSLVIELKQKVLQLDEGDCTVIPAGTLHNPIAKEECLVMLVEQKTTRHTGNVKHEKTKSIEEQFLV